MKRVVDAPAEPMGIVVAGEDESTTDWITMVRRVACPSCGASLSGIAAADLRPITVQWRCLPGQEPHSFEVDCPACRKRALLHIRDRRLWFATDESAAQIRSNARKRARASYDEE